MVGDRLKKTNGPIKKVDVEILRKVLGMLHEYGKCQKSILARKCNMGYDKCVRYLNFLDLIGFIRVEINDDFHEVVVLTALGIKFCKEKLSKDFTKKTDDKSYYTK